MLEMRSSDAKNKSGGVKELRRARPAETNTEWLARAGGASGGDLILIGGVNLTHFRLRVAQSDVRHDLLPSLWSHVVVVKGEASRGDWPAWEVSLEDRDDVHLIPKNNGVREIVLSAYDDPIQFPNIARLSIPRKRGQGSRTHDLEAHVDKFRRERLTLNVPALMAQWYAWIWGAPAESNPLARGAGIPAAVFVEAAYALSGVELTPGLASQSSCPEAIWQSALWWHEFYKSGASLSQAIKATYCAGQVEAAVLDRQTERPR